MPARRSIGLGQDGARTDVVVMERLTTSKETIEKHQRKLMRSCACLYFEINRYTVVLLNDE
jgi:precorrin-6B methylase 1